MAAATYAERLLAITCRPLAQQWCPGVAGRPRGTVGSTARLRDRSVPRDRLEGVTAAPDGPVLLTSIRLRCRCPRSSRQTRP
jgi:hypothetical protein